MRLQSVVALTDARDSELAAYRERGRRRLRGSGTDCGARERAQRCGIVPRICGILRRACTAESVTVSCMQTRGATGTRTSGSGELGQGLSRLLVGVDGSDAAWAAAALATRVAETTDAHAVAPHTADSVTLRLAAEQCLSETARWQTCLCHLVESAAEGAHIESRVVRGRAADALLGTARGDGTADASGATGAAVWLADVLSAKLALACAYETVTTDHEGSRRRARELVPTARAAIHAPCPGLIARQRVGETA